MLTNPILQEPQKCRHDLLLTEDAGYSLRHCNSAYVGIFTANSFAIHLRGVSSDRPGSRQICISLSTKRASIVGRM
jgi:hypothetical protein